MKNPLAIISASLAVCILFFACSKDKDDSISASQEKFIKTVTESLLSANDTAYAVYRNGATRVTVVPGTGDSLASSGSVSFFYAGYILNSGAIGQSNLFVTNSKELAEDSAWSVSDSTSFRVYTADLSKDDLLPGLKEGLTGVKAGEECYIMFTAKYGYGSGRNGTIPANSALAYHIWVEGVQNE